MNLLRVSLLTIIVAVGMALPAAAQGQDKQATSPLVQLLQSKGILSADEAAQLSQAGSADEANARLAQLLVAKGLISQDDYNQTMATTELASGTGSGGGHFLNAVVHVPSNSASTPSPASSDPFTFGAPAEGGIIPAVAPVRVLPIDVPKSAPGGIGDIKLGSGATLTPYGFVKATMIYDSTNSGGTTFGNNDFPLPLLLGDTGPDSGSQFHGKVRSTRLGTNFSWPSLNWDLVMTGKVEFDFEGDYTVVNNRNVSSIRSSQASIRLAWARMDTHIAGLPVFAEFGQDWTLLASSTLPDIIETTQLMAFFGNMYERIPQVKGGVQFHKGDLKVQLEAAAVMAAFGDANLANTPPGISVPANSVAEQLNDRFGARIGSDSGQPGVEGRVVFQYPIFHSTGVAPAQLIFSGHHATGSEIVLHGTLATAGSQTDVPIAALTGCATPGPAGCTVAQFFPQGFRFDIPQNIWTAEFQLPTPWVTVVGKYFNGGDTRFFFGNTNSTFADTMGLKVIANGIADSGDTIPFVNVGGTAVFAQLRPVRDQGGFVQVSFPLSRIFHADPEGHNSGWTYSFTGGVDNTKARDVNRTGANGLTRSDYLASTIRYKINKWASIVNETTWYDTRTVDAQLKLYRGLDAHVAHDWRNEFGTIVVF